MLTAFAVGLAISIGQYLPTQLLGAGRVTTVTTEVALASGSNRRLIGVWALVQAGLPLIGFMLALTLPPLFWAWAAVNFRRKGMTVTATPTAPLRLEQVSIALVGRELLAVDATIAPGEVLTVMGPSGSGKSTLLAYIAGFLDREFTASGGVWLGERDLLNRPAEARGIGLLFQDPLLFPHLSVAGNLRFGLPRQSKHKHQQVTQALEQIGASGV
ncbi:hypothetical protein HSBAA_07930 [Vreelandella sulfidaeris]|uniref:AAA+ ATPase domain-containing protein n=1 Tax=Vreelandella sulfidaeris TaxID=115553 RepID=A0A455U1J1_9GAMM|nr:hypothetical protein HSBAA_07930 [Halomonas sulfidaeris]